MKVTIQFPEPVERVEWVTPSWENQTIEDAIDEARLHILKHATITVTPWPPRD